MNILNKFWQFIAGIGTLLAGILFIKSKIQENKIDKIKNKLQEAAEQLAAQHEEIKLKEKLKNEQIKVSEFEKKQLENEIINTKQTAHELDEIKKQIKMTPDKTEYRIQI